MIWIEELRKLIDENNFNIRLPSKPVKLKLDKEKIYRHIRNIFDSEDEYLDFVKRAKNNGK